MCYVKTSWWKENGYRKGTESLQLYKICLDSPKTIWLNCLVTSNTKLCICNLWTNLLLLKGYFLSFCFVLLKSVKTGGKEQSFPNWLLTTFVRIFNHDVKRVKSKVLESPNFKQIITFYPAKETNYFKFNDDQTEKLNMNFMKLHYFMDAFSKHLGSLGKLQKLRLS